MVEFGPKSPHHNSARAVPKFILRSPKWRNDAPKIKDIDKKCWRRETLRPHLKATNL